jgi:hypothetical protein
LKSLKDALAKPGKKIKKEPRLFKLSDKTIFEQKVLPQIYDKLAIYDQQETLGKIPNWKLNFEFLENYSLLDMAGLKKYHAQILDDERTLACLDLIVKYYRGLIYFRARELAQGNANLTVFFPSEFGVCYETAKRYMTFAALIKRYPRLMICGLTYAQISKHQVRLLDYLKAVTDDLHDRLSQPFTVKVEEQ